MRIRHAASVTPSPQVDPEVLAALPQELQEELRSAYRRRDAVHPQDTVGKESSDHAIWSRASPPSGGNVSVSLHPRSGVQEPASAAEASGCGTGQAPLQTEEHESRQSGPESPQRASLWKQPSQAGHAPTHGGPEGGCLRSGAGCRGVVRAAGLV